jgi:hypothetical protein
MNLLAAFSVATRSPNSFYGPWLRCALPSIVFVLLLSRIWSLFDAINSVPRFVDEESNIYSAYYYKLFFVDRNFSHVDWDNPVSYDYPPVRKYIYGFAMHLFEGKLINTCDGYKAWHLRIICDWFKPALIERSEYLQGEEATRNRALIDFCDSFAAQLKAPEPIPLSEGDYLTCRYVSLVFAILAAGLLSYIILLLCNNVSASLIGGLLFLNNNVSLPGFQQALNDSLWCFFVLLSLVLLIKLAHALTSESSWLAIACLSVATGSSAALALQTKLITAYMVGTIVFTFVFLIVLLFLKQTDGLRRALTCRAGSLSVVTMSSVALFVLLNPYLYHDTIRRIATLTHHRTSIMQIQSLSQEPVISSRKDLARAVYKYGLLLNSDLQRTPALWLLYFELFAVGLLTLISRAICSSRAGNFYEHGIVLVWIISAYLVVGPNIHMEWERYFLPFVMCTVVIVSIGVGAHIDALEARIGQWRGLWRSTLHSDQPRSIV